MFTNKFCLILNINKDFIIIDENNIATHSSGEGRRFQNNIKFSDFLFNFLWLKIFPLVLDLPSLLEQASK